jgi:hypothetical protein
MPNPPDDPKDPGNVVQWPLDTLAINDLSLKDYAAFVELAESQGKSPEALLGEAVRLLLAKNRTPKGPAEIITPNFPKPKDPTLG